MPKHKNATKSNLRGRGDYTVETKKIPQILPRLEAKIDHLEKSLVHATPSKARAASTVGRVLGNFVGQGDLGALAGESLAKMFGHGDYSIKANSLMSSISQSGPNVPKFGTSGKRGIRVAEREFLTDIFSGSLVDGSSEFLNRSFRINPTESTTFPWLSLIASNFDQWEPHGIVFEFISTSSEFNGTSQALGTIIMATDYDGNDPPAPSKSDMANMDYACSTKPSNNLIHGVECEPSERQVKIFQTSQVNALLSLLGNFQIATQGMSTADTKVGELWVSYDISFYKKQLGSYNPLCFTWSGVATATTGLLASPTLRFATNFATPWTITQNIGVGSIIVLDPNIDAGRFLLVYQLDNVSSQDTIANWSYANCNKIEERDFSTSGAFSLTGWSIFDVIRGEARIQTGLKYTTTANYKLQIVRVQPGYKTTV